MRFFVCLVLILLFVGLAYVRAAPSDVAQWHVPVEAEKDTDFESGAVRVLQASPDVLTRADAYMRALQRTQVLAGSVESGRITYVTRTTLFGFPDYTTVEYTDDSLRAYARQRFGKSDMGVNRERLEGLLTAVQ